MKRWLIILLMWASVITYAANEGVGILFDNSGSMRIHFPAEMLQDAKDAVLDLVINGTYDQKTWTAAAESPDYKSRPDKKIWEPGGMIYVHAFGELRSRIEPFFKSRPDFAELKTINEARNFIRSELYRRLDFSDKKTNFKLATYLCWWNLCAQLGSGGKDYYMNVLVVSDFEIDPQPEYAGAGNQIENEFIRNNAGETTLFKLVHNKSSRKDANVKLAIHLVRIGPHFIQPKPPAAGQPPTAQDKIILKSPESNHELNPEKEANIKFAWDTVGKFEKYILEIHSVKPRRKVLIRETQNKQTLVPAKILVSRMESFKADRLVWFVKGVYPENNPGGNISITSNHSYLKKSEGGGSKIWILFLILALIAAVIFGLPKLMQAVKRAQTKKKVDEIQDEGYKSTDDDWGKDIS